MNTDNTHLARRSVFPACAEKIWDCETFEHCVNGYLVVEGRTVTATKPDSDFGMMLSEHFLDDTEDKPSHGDYGVFIEDSLVAYRDQHTGTWFVVEDLSAVDAFESNGVEPGTCELVRGIAQALHLAAIENAESMGYVADFASNIWGYRWYVASAPQD